MQAVEQATVTAIPEAVVRAPAGERDAQRAFSTSILVSATRCLLTYVLLPFVAPALGVAGGVGPVAGMAIGLVAVAANVVSIRRFWLLRHRWRWAYTAIGGAVIGLLAVLLARDLAALA